MRETGEYKKEGKKEVKQKERTTGDGKKYGREGNNRKKERKSRAQLIKTKRKEQQQ